MKNLTGCVSPCHSFPVNSAECELLASQIENFTEQFFGDVVASQIDGKTFWSIPCDLTIGLPHNHRNDAEPLGCYLLRLFKDGVVGLPGVAGAAGEPGESGISNYTVTSAVFVQAGVVVIPTVYNPLIRAGNNIRVDSAGWYSVISNVGGLIEAELIAAIAPIGEWVFAGKIVEGAGITILGPVGFTGPTGAQGHKGLTGDQGPKGDKGVTGDPGPDSPTSGQGAFISTVGDEGATYSTNSYTDTFTVLNFTADGDAKVTLPDAGWYLVQARVRSVKDGAGDGTLTDHVIFRVINTTSNLEWFRFSIDARSAITSSVSGTTRGGYDITKGLIWLTFADAQDFELQVKLENPGSNPTMYADYAVLEYIRLPERVSLPEPPEGGGPPFTP